MSTTVKAVIESFELLFSSFLRKDFRKSFDFHEWSESELLPLVKTFLLGYFGEYMVPEAKVKFPGSPSGHGRVDFIIDDVAVEFAVRRRDDSRAALSDRVNSSEIKKLMKFDGRALLVLFDFSATPYDASDINRFRNWPSLGKGNHKKSAFNVAYFHLIEDDWNDYDVISANIRVN